MAPIPRAARCAGYLTVAGDGPSLFRMLSDPGFDAQRRPGLFLDEGLPFSIHRRILSQSQLAVSSGHRLARYATMRMVRSGGSGHPVWSEEVNLRKG